MNLFAYIFTALIVLQLPGCAETSSDSQSRSGASQPNQGTGGMDDNVSSNGEGQALTRDELVEELLSREAQLNLEKDELAKLEAINVALCDKINKINTQCLPKKPITSNAKIRLISCEGDPVEDVSDSKIEVDIYVEGTGDFTLVFHGNSTIYESVLLKKGTQELKFEKLVSDSSVTPTFADIKKMRLKIGSLSPSSGNAYTRVIVDVLVDGETVLKDTLPAVTANETYELNLREIYQQLVSTTCQLSNEALDDFLAPFNNDGGVNFDNAAGAASSQSSYQSLSSSDLEQRITWAKEALSELEKDLEPARERAFNLQSALKGDTGVGCHLKQKITSLSISIDGSPLFEPVPPVKHRTKMQGSGNAEELEIDLGGVSFTTTNAINGTFIPDQDLTSLDVASLTQISLRKAGTRFDNVLVKCDGIEGSVIGGIFTDAECYEIREEFVMDINRISVEVNGNLTIFDESLDFKLDRNNLTWNYEGLQQNAKWGEMLLRTDCDAVE